MNNLNPKKLLQITSTYYLIFNLKRVNEPVSLSSFSFLKHNYNIVYIEEYKYSVLLIVIRLIKAL